MSARGFYIVGKKESGIRLAVAPLRVVERGCPSSNINAESKTKRVNTRCHGTGLSQQS